MPSPRALAVPLFVAALVSGARAAPGPAPSLDDAIWIRQGPVAAHPDKPLVIEVWATWCGPCHQTFPMLSRLQQDYGDTLRVVAISDDSAHAVRRTLRDQHAQMQFAVATVDQETVQSFLFGGFGGRGLPSTFIVRDGTVRWGGQPDALPAAVREVLGPPPELPRAPAEDPPPTSSAAR